jgi:hypothetical protein
MEGDIFRSPHNTYTKINPRWKKGLNVKSKCLKGNTRKYLYLSGVGKNFSRKKINKI